MLGVLAVLVAVSGALWWSAEHGAVRRVDSACGTWLTHRDALRNALSQTDEAVGRAREARAPRVGDYFNDEERTRGDIGGWLTVGPGVLASLRHDRGASSFERDAARAFDASDDGLVELERLIDDERPSSVASWLPELQARFQMIDDSCLYAARAD